MKYNFSGIENLPEFVGEYIKSVVKRVGNTRRVRREVFQELVDHFNDALGKCTDGKEKENLARELIEGFGDVKLLGVLIKRGKKRCRPWWKKAMARCMQGVVGVIVLFVLYTLWFVSGEPKITVNYREKLNQLSRPTVPEELNAWNNYKNAIALYVEPKGETEDLVHKKLYDFNSLSDKEKQAIQNWIEANETAWKEFVAGSKKTFCWFGLAKSKESDAIIDVILPPLHKLRFIAKMGIWRAKIARSNGDLEAALDSSLSVIRVGKHLQRKNSTLIEQLVGISINSHGSGEMLIIASSDKLNPAQIIKAQEELEMAYSEGYPLADLTFESYAFLDIVQYCFTDGGPGGGHLIPAKVNSIFSKGGVRSVVPFGGLFHAGRKETVIMGKKYYAKATDLAKLSPYELHEEGIKDWADYVEGLDSSRFAFVKIITPSFRTMSKLTYQSRALHEATVTVLALRRWRLERGGYPENLQELLESGYIKSLPSDPYSDGPLKYEKRGDDFILYSIGADFVDDGGQESNWGKDGGDKVFWPVTPKKD